MRVWKRVTEMCLEPCQTYDIKIVGKVASPYMVNKILNKPLSELDTIVVILKKNLDFFFIKVINEGRMDILLSKIS